MKSSKPHGTADGCAIRRGVKIYLINFTEDEISHRLMVVLTVCFNLTKWKSTEIPFFSVNWCCFIEEDVDLSIVFGSGRQPSLRQVLEAKKLSRKFAEKAYRVKKLV
ncbi:hypothetical protein T4C_9662 [Trichinella pseudospiralis]|uniref:Uncharacterized protein n=1 Tax=Trichinella pseudospiralis TaxID=6337 RepID=A0A0V1IF74_TRIPS|nr:hypothetical protein T4C_9662 [Trichinella pseudospiralis]